MERSLLDTSKIKKLLFLGPRGSYSDFAKDVFVDSFKLDCVCTHIKSISSIIRALKDENSESIVAVIPIENSIEGIVRETLDNLASLKKENIKIIGETTLDVKHALITFAENRRDIKVIRSHPQALAQCKKYIQDNYGDTLVEEATLSTSSAVRTLNSEDKYIAAIGSVECAKLYNVPVLEDEINDEINNKTRFILLGKFIAHPSGCDKTSITFSTENKAGALNKILKVLEDYSLNMSYIDSRPSKKELGEYVFYIDFEGHIMDENVHNAIEEIKQHVKMIHIIGSYKSV